MDLTHGKRLPRRAAGYTAQLKVKRYDLKLCKKNVTVLHGQTVTKEQGSDTLTGKKALTERENFFIAYNHKKPAWVPKPMRPWEPRFSITRAIT